MSSATLGKGRGRGVLALTSFKPCPKPVIKTTLPTTITVQHNSNKNQLSASSEQAGTPESKPINVVKPWENENKQEIKVIAKYAYAANPDKPGGFEELTVQAGEKLTLLRRGHCETNNPHWSEVRNSLGQIGYIGTNYIAVLEEMPSALPWLENKRFLEENERNLNKNKIVESGNSGFGAPDGPPAVKPYHSAYANNRATNASQAERKYFCEVCDKNLNGPQPYKMHMNSKAHKEEIEYKR